MSPATRITGGDWRGRVVLTPPGQATRPTQARVREAIFNILRDEVAGARVVDLYAGAGTIGFEALSRGAATAVFVERDRGVTALIRETAARFGCGDRVTVVTAAAEPWVRANPGALAAAGIVFLDAPYRDDSADTVLALLGERSPRLVVCEHHRRRAIPERLGALERVRDYTYGTTRLTILRRHAAAGEDAQA